ncbi:FKBP-type peptidyl-prolyl cis-trans isomerase [Caulobacter hibisci]|uniref:Peptidyl-prolyl cis-trans isomerase n=1 Tax=Caulobacter hibisci TaxID=2035993 RepID=A0ABS0T518_9CAUL|nr:FKBP-type peptidyl-prolyl cis-trans isomerase [Caulobacter hibisci]MBI1686937.1 FKBP-type peptidyl-prolyl cis-trans isomerase [Caulobacter hibisci]
MRSTLIALGLLLAAGPALAQTAPAPAPDVTVNVAANNLVKANAWMAANAKQPGVISLPSGLQYKVTTSGAKDAPSPKAGDIIKVHYEGKLTDGVVFDSSFERGRAMIAPLDGLVPAWQEAIPLMKVGDEWALFVPPALGYGEREAGPIPANSVMIFRVKLIDMMSAD